MENIDLELRIQNTRFISDIIFTKNGGINLLRNCIEILKSEQFAKKQLKNSLLEITAIAFWNDLYYLNFYDTTITELKSKLDTVKSSYECEDDIDEQYIHKEELDWIQSKIEALSTTIELTNRVRQLILLFFFDIDIETLWKQKLIEHNAFQEKCEAENLEREVMRAEIRKNKLIAIKKPDSTPPPKPFTGLLIDYGSLLTDMSKNISDCSSSDLKTIIEHKQLPIGKNKIQFKVKADAIRFIERYNMTKAQFNKIFYFEDGRPLLAGNKDKTEILSDKLRELSK